VERKWNYGKIRLETDAPTLIPTLASEKGILFESS
jgi:hypothetical protein